MKRAIAIVICLVTLMLLVTGYADEAGSTTENSLSKLTLLTLKRGEATVKKYEEVGELVHEGYYKGNLKVDIITITSLESGESYRGVRISGDGGVMLFDEEEIPMIISTLEYARDNIDVLEEGCEITYKSLANQNIEIYSHGSSYYITFEFSKAIPKNNWDGKYEDIDSFIEVFWNVRTALW